MLSRSKKGKDWKGLRLCDIMMRRFDTKVFDHAIFSSLWKA